MSKSPLGASKITVILGLVFIALIGIRTISTPEIWTHLAQGRSNQPLSFVEAADSVNTTHLYDKVVYAFWNMGGAPLLIIFNVICLLAAFILLLQISKKWGGTLSQGFALLISGQLIFQSVDVSPQIMMMLFIALFVYLLSTLKKPAVLFGAMIPLQIVWTNMDGSFLFGPFIAALAAIQAGQVSKGGNRRKQHSSEPGRLAILAVALLAVTLINPYFFKLHQQVFANLGMSSTYWSSLFREYFQVPARDPLIFLVLIIGAGGLITLKKRLPIILTTLAIMGAFLMIRSIQTALLFTVLVFPFMVLSFTAIGEYLTGSFKTLLGKQEKLMMPASHAVLALLFILSIIPVVSNCAYVDFGSASSFGLGAEERLFPEGTEAIIGDPAFPAKAINLAADGGYLAWKYPNRKIFIDYRPGRYDRTLLENLNNMMDPRMPEAYDAMLLDHRPEAIIINTLTPASAQGVVTLLSRQIWKLVYFDGTTAILLLNKEEFASILNNTDAQAAGLAKLEAARAAYAAAIESGCRAGNPAELIGSGKIFLALNRPVESKAIFNLILQGNNKVPGAWIGLGNSHLILKEFDDAVRTLRIATQMTPNNLMAWASYATACKYAGNTDEYDMAMEKVAALIEKNKVDEPAAEIPDVPVAEETSKALKDITIPE